MKQIFLEGSNLGNPRTLVTKCTLKYVTDSIVFKGS